MHTSGLDNPEQHIAPMRRVVSRADVALNKIVEVYGHETGRARSGEVAGVMLRSAIELRYARQAATA